MTQKSKIRKGFFKNRPWSHIDCVSCTNKQKWNKQNPHCSSIARNRNFWVNTWDLHMYKAWAFLCDICRACGEKLTHCWASLFSPESNKHCWQHRVYKQSSVGNKQIYKKAPTEIRLWCFVASVCSHRWKGSPTGESQMVNTFLLLQSTTLIFSFTRSWCTNCDFSSGFQYAEILYLKKSWIHQGVWHFQQHSF